MSQVILEINHLKKSFGANQVLKDISLTVHKGEVISIIGSSGSGKSTFLRSINLLEEPTGGEILFHGSDRFYHFFVFCHLYFLHFCSHVLSESFCA
mgnify:CR=1 FL=1